MMLPQDNKAIFYTASTHEMDFSPIKIIIQILLFSKLNVQTFIA